MFFLPGIPWLQIGHRVLPEGEIQAGVILIYLKLLLPTLECKADKRANNGHINPEEAEGSSSHCKRVLI